MLTCSHPQRMPLFPFYVALNPINLARNPFKSNVPKKIDEINETKVPKTPTYVTFYNLSAI